MTLNGTPNDLIQNLNPISIIIMVPIFERVIYPFLRRRGIDFTPIKRIFCGFLVAGLAMVYASVLQHYIGKTSPCGPEEPSACYNEDETQNPSPINVWVVSGPYILVGMAEIFASITTNEYAFTKAPVRMRSVVASIAQLQVAIASALNFALTAVNVESKFTWLYGSFAVVSWIAGCIFFFVCVSRPVLGHCGGEADIGCTASASSIVRSMSLTLWDVVNARASRVKTPTLRRRRGTHSARLSLLCLQPRSRTRTKATTHALSWCITWPILCRRLYLLSVFYS